MRNVLTLLSMLTAPVIAGAFFILGYLAGDDGLAK